MRRSYIKSVIAYCRKPGNERLVRNPDCIWEFPKYKTLDVILISPDQGGPPPYIHSGRTGTTRKLTNFMSWLRKGIQRSRTWKRPSDMKSLRLEHRSWHCPSTPELPTCRLYKPQASENPVDFRIKKGEGVNPPNPYDNSSDDDTDDDEEREANVKQTNGAKQELICLYSLCMHVHIYTCMHAIQTSTRYLRGFPTTWVASKETTFFVANVFAGVWSLQDLFYVTLEPVHQTLRVGSGIGDSSWSSWQRARN